MYSKDEQRQVIDNIKKTIGEQNSALIYDDLANLITNYDVTLDDINEKDEEIKKIKAENDELLKVNGKLFQKVTSKVDDKPDFNIDNNKNNVDKPHTITLDEVFDEKGNFID